eukprot:COSAG06_NODE_5583_length_3385_cov_7.013390_1_plen_63_part_00
MRKEMKKSKEDNERAGAYRTSTGGFELPPYSPAARHNHQIHIMHDYVYTYQINCLKELICRR